MVKVILNEFQDNLGYVKSCWEKKNRKQASRNYQGHGVWARSQFQIAKYSIHWFCSFKQFNGEYKSYKNIHSRCSKCLSHLPSAFTSKFKGYFPFEHFCSIEQAQVTDTGHAQSARELICSRSFFQTVTTGQLTDNTSSSLTYSLERLMVCSVLTVSPGSSVGGKFNCSRGTRLPINPLLVSFLSFSPFPTL